MHAVSLSLVRFFSLSLAVFGTFSLAMELFVFEYAEDVKSNARIDIFKGWTKENIWSNFMTL